jgi:mono/diheme cytochrome c family protein
MKPYVLAAIAIAGICATGCDRPPSDADAREWTAADHDRAEERARARQDPMAGMAKSAPAGSAVADGGGDDTLVELTWQNQCAQCHGMGGHGDGIKGPMVKAPDLTRADWQSKVKDDEIAAIIREGKNQMPRFDLSEKVTKGLVTRIRSMRGR